MKRILVTGATGFIGIHLVQRLLDEGHEIIATGIEDRIDIKAPWLNHVTYITYNLGDNRTDCYELFQKPDKLIHLAWPGLPNYKELFHFESNLPCSYAFIKCLVLSGLQDVTVAGTCFEYGKQEGEISEEMPTMPVTAYALAKDVLRRFLEELQKHHPFFLKWIRLFYLYGEGQTKTAIIELLKAALQRGDEEFRMSGGEQVRDYLTVEKVVELITKVCLKDDFSGIVNCCSGKPVSIRRLVEDYLRENKKSIRLNLGYYPYSDYEPVSFWGCTKRLFSLVGKTETGS